MDANEINQAAIFHPQDPNDEDASPCVEIAGVQVYVYITDEGTLRISTHYDTANTEVFGDGPVPTEVNIGGTIVYRIDEDGAESHPDIRD